MGNLSRGETMKTSYTGLLEDLADMRDATVAYALKVLERRLYRLQTRKLVLFPYLRAKLMLRRIRHLKEQF
jgi:hypothetical protein